MPCYQRNNLPSGVTATGRTAYQTESACLEACKDGACCETVNGVTACSVKPQCQCQGTGKVFKGVGTTCSPNPCVSCYGCAAPHPSYLSLTFTQTAPISGGYHESLIDLSGVYSVPSVGTTPSGCEFRALFVKQYENALPENPFGYRTLFVTFRIDVIFSALSQAIGISLTGVQLDAADPSDRSAGTYGITISTGDVLPVTGIQVVDGSYTEIIGPNQFVEFQTCGSTVAANRQQYSVSGNKITYSPSHVQCGTFSWSS